jgi:hypothetical protein
MQAEPCVFNIIPAGKQKRQRARSGKSPLPSSGIHVTATRFLDGFFSRSRVAPLDALRQCRQA